MRAASELLRDHVALVTRAADFAARRHVRQRRKGVDQYPYINHLAEVAHLLAETAEKPDAHLVAAGWLHDTLEDTNTTKDELVHLFGSRVTEIVVEVTDDKSLPKEVRKRIQVESTAEKSVSARLLKIADKTSNLRALAANPPTGWDRARIAAYLDWAELVVASCRGLNAKLEKAFDLAVATARKSIADR